MSLLRCFFYLIVMTSISCSTIDIESTTGLSKGQQIGALYDKIEKELDLEERQLKLDRQAFEEEKQIPQSTHHTDVLRLNVGGEIITTTRQTLTKIPASTLYLLFYGRWQHKLQIDQNGNIFLNFNPVLFRHLLDQLQTFDPTNLVEIHPPLLPSFVKPFKKMLKKLGLDQLSSSKKNDIITFNVGGQMTTNRRVIFVEVSNSTSDTIRAPSATINVNNESDVFVDYDPKLFQHLINQLRAESFKNISDVELTSFDERIAFQKMLLDLNIHTSPARRYFDLNQVINVAMVTCSSVINTNSSFTQCNDLKKGELYAPNGITCTNAWSTVPSTYWAMIAFCQAFTNSNNTYIEAYYDCNTSQKRFVWSTGGVWSQKNDNGYTKHLRCYY